MCCGRTCSTRWFQPSLESEPSPPVPTKHLSPPLCGLEMGRTRQVFGKQAVFLRRGVQSLSLLCGIFQQAQPGGGGAQLREASPCSGAHRASWPA